MAAEMVEAMGAKTVCQYSLKKKEMGKRERYGIINTKLMTEKGLTKYVASSIKASNF